MKKILLSFCDSRMHRSASRLKKQAQSMNCFDQIFIANETDLSKEFADKFRDKLLLGSRGFGYWCWKPQIVLQTLSSMSEGDVLLYLDVGCHLNVRGLFRLNQYFSHVEGSKSGVLAFQARIMEDTPINHDGRELLDLSEYKWVKGDLVDYLGVRDNQDIMMSQTVGAGIFFIRKCRASVDLITEWCDIIRSDFSLLDDTPSKSSNFDGFIEHRHDQPMFSVLCKLYNVKLFSAYEYWYPKRSNVTAADWSILKEMPIHARRDKDIGLVNRMYMISRRVLRRLIRALSS